MLMEGYAYIKKLLLRGKPAYAAGSLSLVTIRS